MPDNHPFLAGRSYLRDKLMEFVGSKQQQSGLIYGPKEPGVVIITSGGRHSKNSGYEDKQNDDGSWTYYGQGRKGDQDPGRKGNSMLVSGQRSILLFQTKEPNAAEVRKQGNHKKRYVFKGEFIPAGYEIIRPERGPRKGLQTIRVTLVPTEGFVPLEESIALEPELSLEDMRSDILAQQHAGQLDKSIKKITAKVYERYDKIKKYTLLRAGEHCEYCKAKAPFRKKDGSPYLEVHHILRLADFGDDKIENVIALCPNCHREAHHGENKERIYKEMLLTVEKVEKRQ